MKNILKLICVSISLFLTIIACQKADIQVDNKQLIENSILPTKHTRETSLLRNKLEKEKRNGNLRTPHRRQGISCGHTRKNWQQQSLLDIVVGHLGVEVREAGKDGD